MECAVDCGCHVRRGVQVDPVGCRWKVQSKVGTVPRSGDQLDATADLRSKECERACPGDEDVALSHLMEGDACVLIYVRFGVGEHMKVSDVLGSAVREDMNYRTSGQVRSEGIQDPSVVA